MDNRLLNLIAALGLALALLGAAFDLVPGASPGLNIPQFVLIVAGLVLALSALVLRKKRARRLAIHMIKGRLSLVALITLATLLLLEAALDKVDYPPHFPREVPEHFLDPAPWWGCDEAGCRYVHGAIQTACERREIKGRRCLVNQQGFYDDQEFVPDTDFDEGLRILILGDSFAYGASAKIGHSFVAVLEQALPNATIWNAAMPGTGTNQAVMSYKSIAPLLQPQLTILAFYMNDFHDNMLPVDSYFYGVSATLPPLAIRQYHLDLQGNVSLQNEQSDLYYRYKGVDPPANELHRVIGETRLGSIVLRSLEAVRQTLSRAEGIRLERQAAATREHLLALRDATADTQLFMLIIPTRADLSRPGAHYQLALRIADDLDIQHLDLRTALSETDYANQPDVHWNTHGHRKIGALLGECLQSFAADTSQAICGESDS